MPPRSPPYVPPYPAPPRFSLSVSLRFFLSVGDLQLDLCVYFLVHFLSLFSVCVFIYVSMYVYVYTCIHVYMYICIYVYMYICIYVYIYVHIYIYIIMYRGVERCRSLFVFVCVCACVCDVCVLFHNKFYSQS